MATDLRHTPQSHPVAPPSRAGSAVEPVHEDATRDWLERAVREAEELVEQSQHGDAINRLSLLDVPAFRFPDLAHRALLAESWALMTEGRVDAALTLLTSAHEITGRHGLGDLEQAETLFRLACCRLKLSQHGAATELLTRALQLCEESEAACDRLRANILEWRARCWVRQHDLDRARLDAERSVEAAEASGDPRTIAHSNFQASIVTERQAQFHVACAYAEVALEHYQRVGDSRSCHMVLNNLGGIEFLLGRFEHAVTCLEQSYRIATELEDDVGAAYALSSLAQVVLRDGNPTLAEEHARRAITLLAGRPDHVSEHGSSHLVLARSLMEQERYDDAEDALWQADASFDRFGSVSHRAEGWIVQGDLAKTRGNLERAAERYRKAARLLQDIHF